MNALFCSILVVNCLFSISSYAYGSATPNQQLPPLKLWCLAQDNAPSDQLQAFLDSTCSHLNCAPINRGGACFDPDTLKGHASYALSLDFASAGKCNDFLGTTTDIDPSYGGCTYPAKIYKKTV